MSDMWWETTGGDGGYVNADQVEALTVSIVSAGPDLATAAIEAHTSDAATYRLKGSFDVVSTSDAPALEALKADAREAARELCQGVDPTTITD